MPNHSQHSFRCTLVSFLQYFSIFPHSQNLFVFCSVIDGTVSAGAHIVQFEELQRHDRLLDDILP